MNSEIFARVYFRETSHLRSFMKIKSSQNGEITLSFTDKGKSSPCRELLTLQICLLTLFAKKRSRENFQIYSICVNGLNLSANRVAFNVQISNLFIYVFYLLE